LQYRQYFLIYLIHATKSSKITVRRNSVSQIAVNDQRFALLLLLAWPKVP
jgi:hypothetical protein